jgi:hypothetical protein
MELLYFSINATVISACFLVEKVMASFMADQRVALKPAADESPKIITPDRF